MARHYHTKPEDKPYRFVPLADHVERQEVVGHHRMEEGRWYGHLDLLFVAHSPIHVASGLIVHRDDLAPYFAADLDSDNDDSLILSHVRRKGRRYIPGTSLKGVVRSVVEAITYSCLCHIDDRKVAPSAKRNDERLKKLTQTCSADTGFCPACSLFGALVYAGRVNFRDAFQVAGGGRIARRPVAHPPQPDRSQANKHPTQGIIYYTSDRKQQLKGRKFYLHGQQPSDATGKYEAVEVCKKESRFEGKIDINGLSDVELGLLLKGLGFYKQFRLKVGGSKPFGYGSLAVKNVAAAVTSKTLKSYRDYDSVPSEPGEEQAQFEILAQSLQAVQNSSLLHQEAWERLTELMKMDLVSVNGRY